MPNHKAIATPRPSNHKDRLAFDTDLGYEKQCIKDSQLQKYDDNR